MWLIVKLFRKMVLYKCLGEGTDSTPPLDKSSFNAPLGLTDMTDSGFNSRRFGNMKRVQGSIVVDLVV